MYIILSFRKVEDILKGFFSLLAFLNRYFGAHQTLRDVSHIYIHTIITVIIYICVSHRYVHYFDNEEYKLGSMKAQMQNREQLFYKNHKITEPARLLETFEIIQSNFPRSTATVTPKPLNHITQCQIQVLLKHFQGWRLHHLSGQPSPMPDNLDREKVFHISVNAGQPQCRE